MFLYIFILTNAILLRHGLGIGRFPFLPGRLHVGNAETQGMSDEAEF
jgi:hypothetical protein